MSGLEARASVVPGTWRRISGTLAGFLGRGRMSGPDVRCPGPIDLASSVVADGDALGPGCPGPGR